MNKHIELAKKLKALAERGVGGEKVNAKKMLASIMEKHNLLASGPIQKTVSDLSPNEYKEWLRVNTLASKIKSETFRKQINQQAT